jgi:hypothetical protein
MHRGAAHEDKSDRTLFSVNTLTPRTITVDAGEEFTVEFAAPSAMSRI